MHNFRMSVPGNNNPSVHLQVTQKYYIHKKIVFLLLAERENEQELIDFQIHFIQSFPSVKSDTRQKKKPI